MKNILLLLCILSSLSLHAQDIIFEDDFEGGTTFKTGWTATPGTEGIVDISTTAAFEGLNGVRIGKSSDGGFATNKLDLALDLSAYDQVELVFNILDFFNEDHDEDGLFLSDDGGSNWEPVFTFKPESWCDNQWGTYQPFDIDKLAAEAGLSLTANFVIRFQQYDNADFNGINDEDGFYIDNVIVREPPVTYATLPFEDNFDDGTMKSPWAWVQPENTVSDISTISPISQYGLGTNANANDYWIRMGNKCDGLFATNAVDLHLNLTGKTDVELIFDILDFYEEDHAEDGIYFSDNDGDTFVKVHDFKPESWCDNQWGTYQPFDIDKLAAEAGLSLTANFVIRFQQYDNADFNGINDEDGFYIDNVIVREPPVTYATLPFEDNFDDGTMKSPWAWVQPDSTVTDLNTIIPSADYGLTSGANSNSFWVFMGKLCDNNAFATNALDLHLNLSGQSEVELVFDINSFFDETHAEDGIYFSEDGGNNFIKVIDWDPESWTDNTWFTHPSVNVGLLAIQNGLQLTDRFVIRFQQHDNADFNGTNDEDGIRIDNVFVRNSKLPYITAFTPGIGPVDREVTISGGNFANTQEVLFNEIKADTFIVVDSATLIVKVPAGAETGKISVTNEEGTTSSENDFVVSTEEVAAPYELSAEAVSCFITLNWQDTTGNETGFIVERRMVDSTDFTQIATLGANSTSYADEARVLQNGTEYFYRVRAFSPLGNSAYSNEASATAIVSDNCGGEPPTAPPPAPTGLVASTPDREETQLDLNWNVVEGATSYNVYRQVGGNFEQVGSTTETSYTDRGLAFGTIYIYHVRAYNGRESDPSDTASATTIDKILAIGDDLAEVSELLRLYPNPAQGQLQFTLKNDEYSEVQLRVFNTLGQVQLDQSFIKNQPVIEDAMDISHWKSGMYFVEITQGQFRTVQRVAKQ